MRTRKGFTIVELVVVIAVIAILAAVLIPSFSGIVEKTEKNTALKLAEAAYKEARAQALEDYNKDPVTYNLPRAIEVNGLTYVITEDGSGDSIFSYPDDGSFKYQIKIENKKVSLGEKLSIYNPNGDDYANKTPAENIGLLREEITLTVGQSEMLFATVTPVYATGYTIEWTSSDGQYIAVDQNGRVTAKKATPDEQPAVVTATLKVDGQDDKTVECKVAVTPVKVNFVTLDHLNIKLAINGDTVGTQTLTYTATPAEAIDNDAVTWSSTKASVATVDNSGKVDAAGFGNTIVSVKVGQKTATCSVTVEGIKFTNTLDTTLVVGTEYVLGVEMSPVGNVKWKSDNESIAIVDQNGKITPIAAGSAKISASANGYTAEHEVNVALAHHTVSIDAAEQKEFTLNGSVAAGEKVQLVVNNATVSNWASSDIEVAVVDENTGVVTTRKAGTAVITGKITTNNDAQAAVMAIDENENVTPVAEETISVKITVTDPNTPTVYAVTKEGDNFSFSNDEAVIVADSAYSTVITPSVGYEMDTVTVTMGGEDITSTAYIEEEKKISIDKVTGNIVITVTTAQTEQGEVTPSITLDKTEASIAVGETVNITATVNPAESTVNWSSSDNDVATVENGVVTGVAAGTATITATAGEISANCTVTVTADNVDGAEDTEEIEQTTHSVSFVTDSGVNIEIKSANTVVNGEAYTLVLEATEGYVITEISVNQSGRLEDSNPTNKRRYTYTFDSVSGDIEITAKAEDITGKSYYQNGVNTIATNYLLVNLEEYDKLDISCKQGVSISRITAYLCDLYNNEINDGYASVKMSDTQYEVYIIDTVNNAVTDKKVYICLEVETDAASANIDVKLVARQ